MWCHMATRFNITKSEAVKVSNAWPKYVGACKQAKVEPMPYQSFRELYVKYLRKLYMYELWYEANYYRAQEGDPTFNPENTKWITKLKLLEKYIYV